MLEEIKIAIKKIGWRKEKEIKKFLIENKEIIIEIKLKPNRKIKKIRTWRAHL